MSIFDLLLLCLFACSVVGIGYALPFYIVARIAATQQRHNPADKDALRPELFTKFATCGFIYGFTNELQRLFNMPMVSRLPFSLVFICAYGYWLCCEEIDTINREHGAESMNAILLTRRPARMRTTCQNLGKAFGLLWLIALIASQSLSG